MEKESKAPNHLYYNIYLPVVNPKHPKVAILLLHGMKEHSGRYMEFISFMNQQGYAFVCYDHQGHGRTAKSTVDMGYIRKNKPHELLVSDALDMAYFMQSQFPHSPLLLMGYSMGSFIARLLLQKKSHLFSGAIIMGSGASDLAAISSFPILYLANIFAAKKRSRWLNDLFSKINNVKFKDEQPNDGRNWLSTNLANRLAYQADELCDFDFSNNAFYGLIALHIKATRSNWADRLPREFPLLFISGSDDPIGDFGKGITKTVNALKKKDFTNVTMWLFPGMRHEILGETDKQLVYDRIVSWLSDL